MGVYHYLADRVLVATSTIPSFHPSKKLVELACS
jgi:hypothetical protein